MKIKTGMLFFLLISCIAQAQTDSTSEDSPLTAEAQIISRYVWRGQDIGGNRPFVHPCLELSFGSDHHSVTIGVWGAYALGKQFDEELDLYIIYSYKDFLEFSLTDYFVYTGSPDGYDLFNYKNRETPHLLEVGAGFYLPGKIPLSLSVFMNVYGNDARRLQQDGTDGNIFYSKYIELGYEKEFKQFLLNAFVGFAPDQANETLGEETFYGNTKPGFINLGCSFEKELKLSPDFSTTLAISLISNPVDGAAFMTAGITF